MHPSPARPASSPIFACAFILFSALAVGCAASAPAETDGSGGGSGGSGGGDAGTGGGGGDVEPDAGEPWPPGWWGEPIDAPAGEWTWVEFPGTSCSNGTPTGLGVNLSPSANPSGVLVYFEGGGACWDYEGCISVGDLGTAFHANGFDEGDWDGVIGDLYRAIVPFDREADGNPWKDAHYVFVPYCTADVHAGDQITELWNNDHTESKTMHYRGYHNVTEYLTRLVPTFFDTPRVWVTGSSAGGFGAMFNWFQFVERFGDVRVDVISDSGQPIMPADGTWEKWVATWDLQFPAECEDCDLGIRQNIEHAANMLGDRESRLGLIVYARDAVIAGFLGLSQDEHEERVLEVLDTFDDPTFPNSDRADYFAMGGSFHTTFISGFCTGTVEAEDTKVCEWATAFVNDAPFSVGPD